MSWDGKCFWADSDSNSDSDSDSGSVQYYSSVAAIATVDSGPSPNDTLSRLVNVR